MAGENWTGTTGNDSHVGTAEDDTLVGLAGDDTIVGDNGNDYIDGGEGNDSIRGGSNTPGPRGDDTIISGLGNDTIDGDGGNDLIDNSAGGADNLDGDVGSDTFILSGQEAQVNGGSGNSFVDTVIFAATAPTTLYIDGRYSNIEKFIFRDIDETVRVTNSGQRDSFTLGGGADIIYGNVANLNQDEITDFTTVDRIFVQDAQTNLFAVAGAGTATQTLTIDSTGDGLIGNDDLTIHLPNADLTGVRVVARPGVGTEIFFGEGGATGGGGGSQTGGNGDDLIGGGDGNDTLTGGDGNDTLTGGGGDDSLVGGNGDDKLIGGAGNNTLEGGAGNDVLIGGPGNDLLKGGAGQDTMTGGGGNDTFEGTAGESNGDVITDFGFGDRIRIDGGVNMSAVYNPTGGSIDIDTNGDGTREISVIVGPNWGSSYSLEVNGTDVIADSPPIPVNDSIGIAYNWVKEAQDAVTPINILANDLEDFGLASFTVKSLPTHGTLLINGAAASAGQVIPATGVSGGFTGPQFAYIPEKGFDGADAFTYALTDNKGHVSLTDGVVNLSVAAPDGQVINGTDNRRLGDNIVGTEGSDTINGFSGNDTIDGGLRNDRIDGGLGRDLVRGGLGDDTYVGFGKGDIIQDIGGNDTILVVGKAGFKILPNDLENVIGGGRLTGNANNNLMVGGGGRDQFIGGLGDDTLVGGAGTDRLYGNAGADVFRYEGGGDAGRGLKAADQLLDFQTGVDKLDLTTFGITATQGHQFVKFAGGLVSVDADHNGTIDFDIRVPNFNPDTDLL